MCLVGEHQPVAEHIVHRLLHIVWGDEVAAIHPGMGARYLVQADDAARARADLHPFGKLCIHLVGIARRHDKRDDIVLDSLGNGDIGNLLARAEHHVGRQLLQPFAMAGRLLLFRAHQLHDSDFGFRIGIIDPHMHEETVELRFGIGFNRLTGETAFFDGRKDRREFDWSEKFAPPGGVSYSDSRGRAAAEALYDPTFQVECSACHDNKSPYVITPSVQQARVGYLDRSDSNAIAFSLGNLLPKTARRRSTPFRVIGSAYTATYRISLERAWTVSDPTGNCTQCHTLTTQVTGQRFAADAVAKAPAIIRPTRSQSLRLKAEQGKLRQINAHRTVWATRTGAGKIHPWMLPIEGNSLSTLAPEISSGDWSVLSNCLWGAGGAECDYKPLYTSCPIPGGREYGDISEPVDFSIKVLAASSVGLQTDRVLRLDWKYLNDYGGVPQRDDVRFNVVVKSVEIPNIGIAPSDRDYPGRDEADDRNFAPIAGDVGTSGEAMFIRNVSFLGHSRFTEPTPSTELRAFQLDLPAKCNRRYLVRVVPKRFCFDQNVLVYGRKDYVQHADISCS